jgi:hypothetical protein
MKAMEEGKDGLRGPGGERHTELADAQRLKQQPWSLHGVYIRSSACILWLFRLRFGGSGDISDAFAWSGDPSPPTELPHPALIWEYVPSLSASCYVVCSYYHWGLLFSEVKQRNSGPGWDGETMRRGSYSWDVKENNKEKQMNLLCEPSRGSQGPQRTLHTTGPLAHPGSWDHWWMEPNICSQESRRVLCQQEQEQRNPWDSFWWLQTHAILGANWAGPSTPRILGSLRPVYTREHMGSRSKRVFWAASLQAFILSQEVETQTPGHLPCQRRVGLQRGLWSKESGGGSVLQTSGHLPCRRRVCLQRVLWPLRLRRELDFQSADRG